MKNKILLILFSLFAFSVPKQIQPMNAAKEVALASWLLWQENPYESWMLVNYGLLGRDQSNYEGVPLFRDERFRKDLRTTIGFFLSVGFTKKNNLYAKILGGILFCHVMYKLIGRDENIVIRLNEGERIWAFYIYTLILLNEFGLLKYVPKYVFILLSYLIRNSIINHYIPGTTILQIP